MASFLIGSMQQAKQQQQSPRPVVLLKSSPLRRKHARKATLILR